MLNFKNLAVATLIVGSLSACTTAELQAFKGIFFKKSEQEIAIEREKAYQMQRQKEYEARKARIQWEDQFEKIMFSKSKLTNQQLKTECDSNKEPFSCKEYAYRQMFGVTTYTFTPSKAKKLTQQQKNTIVPMLKKACNGDGKYYSAWACGALGDEYARGGSKNAEFGLFDISDYSLALTYLSRSCFSKTEIGVTDWQQKESIVSICRVLKSVAQAKVAEQGYISSNDNYFLTIDPQRIADY